MLRGDLNAVPVPDLLQIVGQSRIKGCVQLEHVDLRRRIFVDDAGQATYVESNIDRERLGFFLTRGGYINDEILEKLRILESQTRAKTVKLLIDHGYVSADIIRQCLESQFHAVLRSALCMKRGQFQFLEGHLPPQNAFNFTCSLQSLILEGVRLSDEIDCEIDQLGGLDAAYRRNPKTNHSITLAPLELEILLKVQEPMEIGHIINRLEDHNELEVLKSLNHLTTLGLFERIEVQSRVEPLVPDTQIRELRVILLDVLGPMGGLVLDEALEKVMDGQNRLKKCDWPMVFKLLFRETDSEDAQIIRSRVKERNWL
ncbi:MAG: DUF4388 domain-containing protein [Acidobacteria bacterium]|nr:DUF4388 domain-containing protein [Acidobacteriota bacterium]